MICSHSGIEVTQNNNLFLAEDVPDDGCKVLVEHAFVSGVADSVGAYTLIRVTGPAVELRRRVRRRSEPPLPDSPDSANCFSPQILLSALLASWTTS